MGTYHFYEGPLTPLAQETVPLVPAGTTTVLQYIQVGYDGTRGAMASPVVYEVQDADSNVLQSFHADATQERVLRDGLYCGPWGIQSSNGLQIEVDNQDGTNDAVHATFVYGIGRGVEFVPQAHVSTGFSTHTIYPAGQAGTLVHFDVWGTAPDVKFLFEETSGADIAHWQTDVSSGTVVRNGFYCGPWGIDFRDGLQVQVIDNGPSGGSVFFSAQVARHD